MAWMRMYYRIAAGLGTALVAGCGSSSETCPGDAAPDVLETGVPEAAPDVVLTGAIFVDASVRLVSRDGYVCPGISSFSVNPGELAAGQTSQLGVTTIGPMPSVVQWTVTPSSGGSFSDATSLTPTFQCSGPGEVTIQVKVELVVPDAGNVCDGVSYTSYGDVIRCEG